RPPQPMDYVAWLNLRAPNLNRDDMITAELPQLTMATAGILEPVEGGTTKVDPLITTSVESEKIPVEKFAGLPDVAGLMRSFKSDAKRYTLAAHIPGPVETPSPDGPPNPPPPPADKPDQPPAPPPTPPAGATEHLKASKQPINVVVVAD